jgi:predicted RNA binding protein YcfA (HicA-like mRNA interferase family)
MVCSYRGTVVVTNHDIQAYGWQLPRYRGSHQPCPFKRMVRNMVRW